MTHHWSARLSTRAMGTLTELGIELSADEDQARQQLIARMSTNGADLEHWLRRNAKGCGRHTAREISLALHCTGKAHCPSCSCFGDPRPNKRIVNQLAAVIDSDSPPSRSAVELAQTAVALLVERSYGEMVLLERELKHLVGCFPRTLEGFATASAAWDPNDANRAEQAENVALVMLAAAIRHIANAAIGWVRVRAGAEGTSPEVEIKNAGEELARKLEGVARSKHDTEPALNAPRESEHS